ncbi:AraC family transcriptional regulator [Paenibacillus sp. V4I7]|uniref:AraC family transcriptional regulator n=1 Tax=Paenibacillus sp. V4I7 TaxID=3042307 RepID=UPI00278A5C4A|nr:AraC family transcriptional regulator [Paenibacillus sp. V4I7]MDQ0897890.1 AraC family transcriptional regulator of arabinose operon [Paenibacillus sp. V4I7]
MTILPLSLELGLSYGKITCEDSWKWDRIDRPFEDCDLWYVWSGEGEMLLNGHTYALSRGSCFLFRPGDLTLAKHNPHKPLTITYIHFPFPSLEVDLPDAYRIVSDSFMFETMLNRYVETLLNPRFGSIEEAKLMLNLLLIYLNRDDLDGHSKETSASHHLEQPIREVASFIRQNPSMSHSMENLAERAQLSPRYFSIKFKEIMKVTLEIFIIQTKIERAEHLLRFSGMKVTEVAEALGYRNIYFFSRQFKQFTGKKASDLRKSTSSELP